MLTWFQKKRSINARISVSMIEEVAFEFASKFGNLSFEASNNWCQESKELLDFRFRYQKIDLFVHKFINTTKYHFTNKLNLLMENTGDGSCTMILVIFQKKS